jgi:hypothetical protein
VAEPDSGTFLEGPSDWRASTAMTDAELRVAVRLRLGLPCPSATRCACGAPPDASGDHALTCRELGGRSWRHAALNAVVLRAFRCIGSAASLEPTGLLPDGGRRPDGVGDAPWMIGRRLAWDATCVHPTSASNLASSSAAASAAARAAESRKRAKYADISPDCVFVPVAVETYGRLGPSASRLLRRLGKAMARSSGDRRASFDLRRRFSIAVQRGNARCLRASQFDLGAV